MHKSILFIFIFISHLSLGQVNSIKEIVQRMNKANASLQSAKFTIYGEERLKNGKMMITERLVKLKVKPKQVYFYSVQPDPGMEVIWRDGVDENKMLISPASFPYMTFSLKHTSDLARKNTHHAISDMGFEYVVGLINHYVNAMGEKIFNSISIEDTVKWQGHSCIHIVIDFKDFRSTGYKVQKGENVSDIAAKLHVNDYMILSLNTSINDFDDVRTGQFILVPTMYGSRIEFFIDRISWLPVKQVIYDAKGMYERYEFRDLLINPPLKAEEFTPDYKDYKF
jgi:outer membrane lipoprotein-sorting protein